jgi:FtsP/CotA-like multicopper oxidase with cupredoxin domain
VFDGVPDASIGINMGATLTYYYNIQEPGTYLYHCHVEAAEHMQMGMQGNLYVHPAQDGTSIEYPLNSGRFFSKFVYNDVDGSTGYDVEMPLQITGFDPAFHDASKDTQPLPFADMKDTYHMFNGRGYPMTVQANNYYELNPGLAQAENITPSHPNGYNSQPYSSRQEVTQGQKLLVRITNLSVTQFHTVTALGLPMKVVGQGAKELAEKYDTSSVNLGGGESYDVVIDTQGVAPGTYFMFVTELNQLSNDQQSFGGPMTEIVINPAI